MALGVSRSQAERVRRRVREAFVTMPALPNQLPFNDMVMDGILKLDRYEVKTRSTPYWAKHVGKQILFYNSTRVAGPCMKAHGYDIAKLSRRALIGTGKLIDVRPLTGHEGALLFLQFNNLTPMDWRTHMEALRSKIPGVRLAARSRRFITFCQFGLFFENVQRFKNPVPFAWPSGPVQERQVPLSLVAKALREIGVDPGKIREKIAA